MSVFSGPVPEADGTGLLLRDVTKRFGATVAVAGIGFGGFLMVRRLIVGPESEGVFTLFAILFIFVGSWYPAGFPKLSEWNTWMIAVAGISVLAGIAIYLISQAARKGKTDEELIVLGAAEQEIREDMPSA